MVQKILDGLSGPLGEAFGCPVYSEEREQGFAGPCFFISLGKPSQQRRGTRYLRKYPLDVGYFPPEGPRKNAMLASVGEQLYEVLEYVQTEDGCLGGADMHYEITEGVLHFFVSYSVHLIRQEEQSKMEELQNTAGLKE